MPGGTSPSRSCAAAATHRLWLAALCASGLIHLAHIIALPILITFDGHWYLKLADTLGTPRFTTEWDFLRTPLEPALLKLAFWILGKGPLAVIALHSLFAFAGVWLLGAALKRLGREREAAVAVLLLSAYPTLIAYEHSLLTEAGSFFFIALLVYLLAIPVRQLLPRAIALAAVLTLAFYYRSSFLFLAPLAAVVFGVTALQKRGLTPSPGVGNGCLSPFLPLLRTVVLPVCVVAFVPFLAAYPWQRNPAVARRTGESVLLYGLVRQAVLSPEDPLLGAAAPAYRQAIAKSSNGGRLPLTGLRNAAEYPILGALPGTRDPNRVFIDTVLSHPQRYAAAVLRNLLLLAGLGGYESDSAAFRAAIFSGRGSIIFPGPPGFTIEKQFQQPTRWPALARALDVASAPYDVLVFLGFLATCILLALGLWRRDPAMLALSSVPLAFIAFHALVLSSQDRMAAPVYPVLLLNLVALPGWLPAPRHAARARR